MDSLTIIFILNGVFFVGFFLLKNIHIPLILSLLTLFVLFFVTKQKKIPTFQTSLKLRGLLSHNNQYVVTIACLIVFIVLEKFIGFNSSLFLAFFIFAFLNKLSSRASFVMALIFFIVTVLFTIGSNIDAAQDMIVLVYYFLVIGVIWQIIERRNEGSTEEIIVDQEEEQVAPIKFMLQRKSRFNFTINYKAILIIVIVLLLIAIIFLVVNKKPLQVKKKSIAPTVIPAISITPTPLRHVPLVILNGTGISGLANSTANTLRKAGWGNEFDISINNYDGSSSSNILQYTKTLEGKIKLLERDLHIQITPIILKDATREAEIKLILGK